MPKTFISKEKISLSASLVVGNRVIGEDDKVIPLTYNKPKDVESFGLWETSSPCYNTYYPDVKPEDLKPKESDYIYPTFRGLSEVIVRPQWPIDFGVTNALKESMHLLRGIAVYPNHEMISGDELGVVYSAEWQESRTVKTENGEDLFIPAGVNLVYKLDGKSNPRICRNIQMDPPAIHSTSLTVEFRWEQSHPELTTDEFWDKLGSYDKDGNLIKRNVIEILRYYEASLVPHGADPFAKLLDKNGNPALPDSILATYQFSEDKSGEVRVSNTSGIMNVGFSFKEREMFSNSILNPVINNNQSINNDSMNLLEKLKSLGCSIPEDVKTEEQLAELFIKGVASLTEVEGFKTKNSELGSKVENLTGEVRTLKESNTKTEGTLTQLKAEKEVLEGQVNLILEGRRKEALRLCALLNEGTVDENIKKQIQESNLETSQSLMEQYQKLAKEKFGESVLISNTDPNKPGSSKKSLEEDMEELIHRKHKPVTTYIHEESK